MNTLDLNPRLSSRQIYVIAVSATAQLIDFLDFFLISFVLAFVAKPWGLTVWESTIILLSSGVGAVLGSFICGALSDKFGRRPVFLTTIVLFALGTGALAFTPEGSWVFVASIRFIVGFGTTGIYAANIPLLQEFMPSRRRGLVSGIVATFIPVGILLGSALVAFFGDVIGWRGLFIVGAVPAIPLFFAALFIPESPLWLSTRGKTQLAKRSIGWALKIPAQDVKLEHHKKAASESPVALRELFKYPRSLVVSWGGVLGAQTAYYGVTLWAPVLLVLLLGVSPAHAAFMLIFASLGDIFGRIFFSYASEKIGRRKIGMCQGFLGAALLVITALCAQKFVGGVSIFWLLLIASYFIISGAFAVTVPYAAEIWPSRLRASGLGSAYGVGSLGKIIGPLGLGLLLGSNNSLAPEASIEQVLPAFSYLAAWLLATGLIFAAFAIETRGRSFESIEAELEDGARKDKTDAIKSANNSAI